jgi:predicted MPP superfamily phosphohydrolase
LLVAVFLLVVLLLVGVIHWYLWRRLVRDTTRPGRWRRAGTVLVIALAVLLVGSIAGRGLPMREQAWLAWPGYLWLAAMFYLLLVLLFLDVVRLPARIWRRFTYRPGPDPDRRRLMARSAAIAAGIVAVGATGTGMVNALGPPRIWRAPIRLAKLPRGMDGFRIALVADIHLGPLLGRGHTARIVSMINDLDVDLVAVVGDLVDGTVAELGKAAEPLHDLRSRHGSYFVTGNHEYFSGYQPWIGELTGLGLKVLRNERVEIDGIDLAGVNDVTGGSYGDAPDYGRALDGRDESRPVILLAHQPVQVHEAVRRRVDLQLSGHTHGGQMFPFSGVVRLQQPVLAGYARFGGTQLFVTRGAGFWGPPVRVGAPPDITLVELRG